MDLRRQLNGTKKQRFKDNMKKHKIIAIIPARGGSKELPGKNIKPLLEKPLIAWTIEQAKKSKYIDKLIVSTDYQEIADIAKTYGVEVPFLRPKKFAKDGSPSWELVIHAIEWFAKKNEFFDIIVLLEPTSPLRKENDIDKAIEIFVKNLNKADALISVGEIHLEIPQIAKKIEKGYMKPFARAEKIYQRQQASKSYFPYGVIYLSKVDTYRTHKTFYQKRIIPYPIERWQNYEIDDNYDFICVEAILRARLKKKR